MAQFEELEALLETERRSIEASRKQLYADRLAVQRQLMAVGELVRKAKENPQGADLAGAMGAAMSSANGVPQQGPVIQANENTTFPPQGTYAQL